jgi:hypothetical protein
MSRLIITLSNPRSVNYRDFPLPPSTRSSRQAKEPPNPLAKTEFLARSHPPLAVPPSPSPNHHHQRHYSNHHKHRQSGTIPVLVDSDFFPGGDVEGHVEREIARRQSLGQGVLEQWRPDPDRR